MSRFDLEGVVFDVDGVLFDTERLSQEIWNAVSKRQLPKKNNY